MVLSLKPLRFLASWVSLKLRILSLKARLAFLRLWHSYLALLQVEQSLVTACLTKVLLSTARAFLIASAITLSKSSLLLAHILFNLFMQPRHMLSPTVACDLHMKQRPVASDLVALPVFLVFTIAFYTVNVEEKPIQNF